MANSPPSPGDELPLTGLDLVIGRMNDADASRCRAVLEANGATVHLAMPPPTSGNETPIGSGTATVEGLAGATSDRDTNPDAVGRLVIGLTHELNNVLSPIVTSLQMLRVDDADVGNADLVRVMSAAADRAASLVRQMLALSRGSAGGGRSVINAAALVRGVMDLLEATTSKSIAVESTFADDVFDVCVEPMQIQQVLLNICVTTRDALQPGGRIVVRVANAAVDETYAGTSARARVGRYVRVAVSTAGRGLSDDHLQRIFEPFVFPGSGAGSVRGATTITDIVSAHDGFVEVDAGESELCFYLPVAEDVAKRQPAKPEGSLRGNGEVVLVVDDEPSIREVARRSLGSFGYHVIVAADGAEAAALLAQRVGNVHVAVVDMMMPLMDGTATIRVLRKLAPGIAIIATSGTATEEDERRARNAGAARFVPKPYAVDTMLTALRQAIEGGVERDGEPTPG